MLSKVDLPQPLGPITATISRGATARLMSRTASTTLSRLWKLFDTWRSSIMGGCARRGRAEARPLLLCLPPPALGGGGANAGGKRGRAGWGDYACSVLAAA